MTRALDLLRQHHVRAVPYAPGRVKLQSQAARVVKSRIDESAMSAAFVISTPAEDRQGEVVIPKGCIPTLATYTANPVVHLNHRTDEHPVALSKNYHGQPGIDVFEDRCEGVAHFHGKTQLSEQTWELTLIGVYVAASVGFRPLLAERQAIEADPRDLMSSDDEIDFNRKSYRIVFRRWELVEWSITGVPCNQDAVVPLDYRELVTRTLQKGLGGRPVLPVLRQDLAPLSLVRKSWATTVKGDSYFSDCERDEAGHCLPSGQAGSGGEGKPAAQGEAKPAGSYYDARDAHESEVARLKEEHAAALEEHEDEVSTMRAEWEDEHDAWQARQEERDDRRSELESTSEPDVDRSDLFGEKSPGERVASGKLTNPLDEGNWKPYARAVGKWAPALPEKFEEAYGEGSSVEILLADQGATEADIKKLRKAAAAGAAAVAAAVEKHARALDEAMSFQKELDDLEEVPDPGPEPDEPDEEDAEAHAAWEKGQAAWQEAQDAFDAYEEKGEAMQARLEELSDAESEALMAIEDAWSEGENTYSEAEEEVKAKLLEKVDAEEAADDEPDEPDYPDEPEEPDYPEPPDPSDFDEGEEEKRWKDWREEDHPRADDGKFGSGGGSGGSDSVDGGSATAIDETKLPDKARSRLAKLRDALASAASGAVHPSRTAKKAVAAARAKLKAMHEKYGTTGTVLILGAAVVATPVPVPGATPLAVWAVSKLLSVLGMAKPEESKSWLAKGDDPEGEELSEEEAERLGREFVEEFLAGCGLSPDLESLEGDDVEESKDKAQAVYVPKSIAATPELASELVARLGLDASVFEEESADWVFRQADVCDCQKGVVCDEQGCRVVRGPICSCEHGKGKVEPVHKGDTTMADEHEEDQRPVEGEGEGGGDEGEAEAEEVREKAALKAGAMWLKGHRAYCKAAEESVEHAGVLKAARRALKCSARTARKYYGDRYKDMGYEDADHGGGQSDEEEAEEDAADQADEQEKAIQDAFEKVMSDLFGRARAKSAVRELKRTGTNNGH